VVEVVLLLLLYCVLCSAGLASRATHAARHPTYKYSYLLPTGTHRTSDISHQAETTYQAVTLLLWTNKNTKTQTNGKESERTAQLARLTRSCHLRRAQSRPARAPLPLAAPSSHARTSPSCQSA